MKPVLTHLALHVADLEKTVAFYGNYCGMKAVHSRGNDSDGHVVWLAESGREKDLVFVLIEGGRRESQASDDYSHIGFALESREAVDAVASRAREEGILVWEPKQLDYPVGYFCAVEDPDGNYVEFSYGQPLGPGAN
jgi:catechol 2,3-dioxygenase-like lactoylglutathione lyase family enzyme